MSYLYELFFIIIFIFIIINHVISLKQTHLFFGTFLSKMQPQVLLSICLILCQFQSDFAYKSVTYKKASSFSASRNFTGNPENYWRLWETAWSFLMMMMAMMMMMMMTTMNCFCCRLTDERGLFLFADGTIVRDPHYCKFPLRREQDLNLQKALSCFAELSCAVVITTTPRGYNEFLKKYIEQFLGGRISIQCY